MIQQVTFVTFGTNIRGITIWYMDIAEFQQKDRT